MRYPRTLRRRRGLTLLETMLSMFVVVVMGAMVTETLSNSIEINRILEDRDVTTRSARVALSKLRREVQLAYLTPNQNAIERYQTVFVGEDNNPDTLYLASLAHQRLYMNSRECDQTEITVWAESTPSDLGDGNILYHREAPRIDEEPAEQGAVYPLAYNVEQFNLRYLDSQSMEWKDEWDSRGVDTAGRLPRAVEIGLLLIGVDPEDPDDTVEIPFLTSVVLEYAPPLNDPGAMMGMLQGMGGLPGTNGSRRPGSTSSRPGSNNPFSGGQGRPSAGNSPFLPGIGGQFRPGGGK